MDHIKLSWKNEIPSKPGIYFRTGSDDVCLTHVWVTSFLDGTYEVNYVDLTPAFVSRKHKVQPVTLKFDPSTHHTRAKEPWFYGPIELPPPPTVEQLNAKGRLDFVPPEPGLFYLCHHVGHGWISHIINVRKHRYVNGSGALEDRSYVEALPSHADVAVPFGPSRRLIPIALTWPTKPDFSKK